MILAIKLSLELFIYVSGAFNHTRIGFANGVFG